MTVDAVAGYLAKSLGFVTGIALDVVVLAEQRETSEIMIKERCILPLGLVVAFAALLTKRPGMWLIILMTE